MKRARNVAQRAAEARRIQDAIRRGNENEGIRPGLARRLGLEDEEPQELLINHDEKTCTVDACVACAHLRSWSA